MRGIGVQPCRQPISAIARKRDWISPQGESRLSESPSPCCRLLKKSATPPRLFIALSQVQGRLGEPNSSKLSEACGFRTLRCAGMSARATAAQC